MQFLTVSSLLALAAYVAADQTFKLTASGDGLNSPVTINGNEVTIEDGSEGTFTLQEPSGFVTVGDSELALESVGTVRLVLTQ